MTARSAAAAILLVLPGAASAGWFGGPAIPAAGGMTGILEGALSINTAKARYAISAGSATGLASALDAAAREDGWLPEPEVRVMQVPAGEMALRSYRRGARWLLQGVVNGKAGDPESAVAVQAVFDSVPEWAGAGGEAPGREPAGWPRLAGARRLLHLGGDGFEAACYSTPAAPRSVVAEAARRLAAAGWRTDPLGDSGLAARRAGSPETALWARPEGSGAFFIVIATKEAG